MFRRPDECFWTFSENFWRLPKTFKEDPKMFWSYTNEFKEAQNSFHFPKLVLQVLFQIKFGLSYQWEIYHRNKWNVIESLHHIFFPENLLPWQPYNAFSCNPKIESYCVIKRTGGEIFSNSYITCDQEWSSILCKFKKIL